MRPKKTRAVMRKKVPKKGRVNPSRSSIMAGLKNDRRELLKEFKKLIYSLSPVRNKLGKYEG